MTPRTVVVAPLRVMDEPTMAGSEWKRVRQRCSESKATGARPG